VNRILENVRRLNRKEQFHLLQSPRRPECLRPDSSGWLDWGSDEKGCHWIEMPVGPHSRAVRCDAHGKPRKQGEFWRLVCG